MSYSRWHNNYFYTYQASTESSKKIAQTFACAPNPKDTDGEYKEFRIQYGSLKKENLREKFLEECVQFAYVDDREIHKHNLNNLIEKFMKQIEENYQ